MLENDKGVAQAAPFLMVNAHNRRLGADNTAR